MVKLERELRSPVTDHWWRLTSREIAGHIPVHALRFPASKARNAHLKGQIIEYGFVDERAGRGRVICCVRR